MDTPADSPTDAQHNPLLALIDLGHKARAATRLEELAFLLVNDSVALHPCRQTVLWWEGRGITAVSGVLQPDKHSPMLQWLQGVLQSQHGQAAGSAEARRLNAQSLPPTEAEAWARWLPAQAWYLPLPVPEACPEAPRGAVWVAADHLPEDFLPLWQEWLQVWMHAYVALWQGQQNQRRWWPGRAGGRQAQRSWYRKPWLWATLAAGALALPVPLTVVAQAELVPKDPVLVRAPLDGVLNEFHVVPNQTVHAGQALFSYDNEAIKSRLQVARQMLAAAQAEYRQAAQTAFTDPKAKFQLAGLVARIQEKQTEVRFLSEQVGRTTVLAPQAGVVLFDEVSEWVGKPVQTGERVVRLADPHQVEIEAWVGLGDAVPLDEQSAVKLFFAADPLQVATGHVRWVGYESQPRPDGTFAYRVRARLDAPTTFTVGAKGTARLTAGTVSLGFLLFRKPLAVVRGYLML